MRERRTGSPTCGCPFASNMTSSQAARIARALLLAGASGHAPGRDALGVPRAANVAYVFGTVDAGIIGVGGPPVQPNDVDRRVSAQM